MLCCNEDEPRSTPPDDPSVAASREPTADEDGGANRPSLEERDEDESSLDAAREVNGNGGAAAREDDASDEEAGHREMPLDGQEDAAGEDVDSDPGMDGVILETQEGCAAPGSSLRSQTQADANGGLIHSAVSSNEGRGTMSTMTSTMTSAVSETQEPEQIIIDDDDDGDKIDQEEEEDDAFLAECARATSERGLANCSQREPAQTQSPPNGNASSNGSGGGDATSSAARDESCEASSAALSTPVSQASSAPDVVDCTQLMSSPSGQQSAAAPSPAAPSPAAPSVAASGATGSTEIMSHSEPTPTRDETAGSAANLGRSDDESSDDGSTPSSVCDLTQREDDTAAADDDSDHDDRGFGFGDDDDSCGEGGGGAATGVLSFTPGESLDDDATREGLANADADDDSGRGFGAGLGVEDDDDDEHLSVVSDLARRVASPVRRSSGACASSFASPGGDVARSSAAASTPAGAAETAGERTPLRQSGGSALPESPSVHETATSPAMAASSAPSPPPPPRRARTAAAAATAAATAASEPPTPDYASMEEATLRRLMSGWV